MLTFKKIVKFVSFTLLALFVLWCVALSFVFSPRFLTPRVEAFAQHYVKGEFKLKNIDVSLFDRFPNITLRIDSLSISQTKDSIDDLLFARQCRVAFEPLALLSKQVKINYCALSDASVYIYVDSLHGPLKCFNLPGESAPAAAEPIDTLAAAPADSATLDLSDYRLSLNRMVIDSVDMVINDRTRDFYTQIRNFGLDMSLQLSSHVSSMNLSTGFDNLLVWKAGELYVKKTSMGLESDILIDRDSMRISFSQADLRINDIDFKSSGTLQRDTIKSCIGVDITSSLNTPSLAEFLSLVPDAMLKDKDKITTQGELALDLIVEGNYSDSSMPTFTAKVKVDNAQARYATRPLSLDEVDCDAEIFYDPNVESRSYVALNNLFINTSGIIELAASSHISDFMGSPHVDLSLRSNIDFDRFSELFPLNDGLICKGSNQSDIKTNFAVQDIMNGNYAKLYIDGESTFKEMEITFDANKFLRDSSNTAYLYIKAHEGKMLFGDRLFTQNNSRTLRSSVNLSGLSYMAKSGEYMTIQDVTLSAGANFDRKSSEVNGLGIRGVAQNSSVGIEDLFSATLKTSDVTLTISPRNENHPTKVTAKILSEEIAAKELTFNTALSLSSANMNFAAEQAAEKEWDSAGTVAFANFGLRSEYFPLDINIYDTTVSLADRVLSLNNASVAVGESKFVASGSIKNVLRKFLVNPRAPLSGDLTIDASLLNVSEIMEASNQSYAMLEQKGAFTEEEKEEVEVVTPQVELVPTTLFRVPRGADFTFDLNIDKTIYEDTTIDNIIGKATLKNGAISLQQLSMHALGADAVGSMSYKNARRGGGANVDFNIDFAGMDINRIGELGESINAMFPMLKSFEGIVDFSIAGKTDLLRTSEVDYSTLRSAMSFKGRDLVLMDGETFAAISRMLLFKNKKRNLIESLEIYALVDKTKVDVLPFEMTIDRYTAYIAGDQVIDPATFDINYDYDISIIESPLPFKAGVTVKGDLNDFKFKLTGATLKKVDFKKQRKIYEEYRREMGM